MAGPVTRQSRVQTTSSITRIRGARGNVRHVHERPSCELPLSRGIEYDQFQLSHVGFELYSTTGLKLAVCGACLKGQMDVDVPERRPTRIDSRTGLRWIRAGFDRFVDGYAALA